MIATEHSGDVSMWVIYDHPRDMPGYFVARLHRVAAHGARATQLLRSEDLDALRDKFIKQGLVCITRAQDDDPVIVETWL